MKCACAFERAKKSGAAWAAGCWTLLLVLLLLAPGCVEPAKDPDAGPRPDGPAILDGQVQPDGPGADSAASPDSARPDAGPRPDGPTPDLDPVKSDGTEGPDQGVCQAVWGSFSWDDGCLWQ